MIISRIVSPTGVNQESGHHKDLISLRRLFIYDPESRLSARKLCSTNGSKRNLAPAAIFVEVLVCSQFALVQSAFATVSSRQLPGSYCLYRRTFLIGVGTHMDTPFGQSHSKPASLASFTSLMVSRLVGKT